MAFTSNFRNPFTFTSFGGNKALCGAQQQDSFARWLRRYVRPLPERLCESLLKVGLKNCSRCKKITRSKTATAGIFHFTNRCGCISKEQLRILLAYSGSYCSSCCMTRVRIIKVNWMEKLIKRCWMFQWCHKRFCFNKNGQKCNHVWELHCWAINYFGALLDTQ